jgi:hypothetical protein
VLGKYLDGGGNTWSGRVPHKRSRTIGNNFSHGQEVYKLESVTCYKIASQINLPECLCCITGLPSHLAGASALVKGSPIIMQSGLPP